MPAQPKFNKDGSYRLRTKAQRYEAAKSVLGIIATIPTAYYSSGPKRCVDMMVNRAESMLMALHDAEGAAEAERAYDAGADPGVS